MAIPTLYVLDTLSPVTVQILIPAFLILLTASLILLGNKSSIKDPPNKVKLDSMESITLFILFFVSISSSWASLKQSKNLSYSS